MKRVIVLTAGLVVGVLLSGLGAAVVVPLVPENWRGEPLVWTLTAAITILTMTVFGVILSRPDK
jgi:hypothetical protein